MTSPWTLLTFDPLDVTIGSDHRSLDDSGYSQDCEISPLAFAGALRTRILLENGYDFGKAPAKQSDQSLADLGQALGVSFRGDKQPVSVNANAFSVRGPLQFQLNQLGQVNTFWPAPRFVVQDKFGKVHRLHPKQSSDSEYVCDDGLEGFLILESPSPSCQPITRPCTFASLRRSLAGGDLVKAIEQEMFAIELRTGHRRSSRGVTEDQALFSRETRRFRDSFDHRGRLRLHSGYAVLASIEPSLIPEQGSQVRLGGDGHTATIDTDSATKLLTEIEELKTATIQDVKGGDGLLLYLGSPAIFGQNPSDQSPAWMPPLPEETYGVRLVAAAVDSPRTIAGWDVGRGCPKTPMRAVPAGATYFYEVIDAVKAIDRVVEVYHCNESLTDFYGELGFGLALCGSWKR